MLLRAAALATAVASFASRASGDAFEPYYPYARNRKGVEGCIAGYEAITGEDECAAAAAHEGFEIEPGRHNAAPGGCACWLAGASENKCFFSWRDPTETPQVHNSQVNMCRLINAPPPNRIDTYMETTRGAIRCPEPGWEHLSTEEECREQTGAAPYHYNWREASYWNREPGCYCREGFGCTFNYRTEPYPNAESDPQVSFFCRLAESSFYTCPPGKATPATPEACQEAAEAAGFHWGTTRAYDFDYTSGCSCSLNPQNQLYSCYFNTASGRANKDQMPLCVPEGINANASDTGAEL